MNPNIIPIIKQINNYETRLENLNNWKEMFKNYNTLLNKKKKFTIRIKKYRRNFKYM